MDAGVMVDGEVEVEVGVGIGVGVGVGVVEVEGVQGGVPDKGVLQLAARTVDKVQPFSQSTCSIRKTMIYCGISSLIRFKLISFVAHALFAGSVLQSRGSITYSGHRLGGQCTSCNRFVLFEPTRIFKRLMLLPLDRCSSKLFTSCKSRPPSSGTTVTGESASRE